MIMMGESIRQIWVKVLTCMCLQVVAKCRELGHKDGKYHYIVADMMKLESTEHLIKVREMLKK